MAGVATGEEPVFDKPDRGSCVRTDTVMSGRFSTPPSMDDYNYLLIILLTFVGFVALAAILLVPVYLFLKREERASDAWTPEALARRRRDAAPPRNGTPSGEDKSDG